MKKNGINKIEIPGKEAMSLNGTKEQIEIEYEVQLKQEYKITITLANGQKKEETILINEYYHKITKNFSEGIKIDNTAVKAAYNQPYKAKITAEGDYAIDTLTVTMGGTPVTVDKTTGEINIEKVTGDIEITATAKKVEITVTEPIIGTTKTATSSVNDNSQTRGTTLYINFSATIEGTACTIEPTVPYAITKNGTYTFIVTGTYSGKTLTKEIEVVVNKYEKPTDLVQYDAGEWTEKEINELKSLSLYNINTSKTASTTTGLNYTFGGFEAGMSRNTSISPESGYGTPRYDGWQVLEREEKDGKIYVTKLVHAGSPENFVYYYATSNDAYRAEYILSSGTRQTSYNTYKARNWDMYKDKELDDKEYIKDVHLMTYDEAYTITGDTKVTPGIINTGASYWLASNNGHDGLYVVHSHGGIGRSRKCCSGIRPVVSLEDGVYIASGSGTEADPYILGKD